VRVRSDVAGAEADEPVLVFGEREREALVAAMERFDADVHPPALAASADLAETAQ